MDSDGSNSAVASRSAGNGEADNAANGIHRSARLGQVTVDGSTLHIHELVTNGPAFVAVSQGIARGENGVVLVQRILDVGGSMAQHGAAQATVDAVGSEVERVIEALAIAAGERLPKAMEEAVGSLEKVLGARFEGKDSVQAQLTDLLRKASDEQRQQFVRALIAEGGPLGAITVQLAELSRKADEQGRLLTSTVERLAASARVEAEYERGAAKGVDFQEIVHAAVDHVVAPYQDIAEFTGDTLGSDRNKKGDSVVYVDKQWTHGRDVRVVVESKDERHSMNAAMAEVAGAMSNREAGAGIVCFASTDKAPTYGRVLRLCGGNRLVCVYDREERNPLALECALQVARAMAIAASAAGPDGIDTARIGEAVARLVEIVEVGKAIKRGSNAAAKGLQTIDAAYEEMRSDALEIVEQLRDALAG